MKKRKPNVLVFASGGGSGFWELVEQSLTNPPILNAHVIGVVSNHENGGVREKADNLKIPFHFWEGQFDAAGYQQLVSVFEADYVMLSGWLKPVKGLDPARTINIHPGPLNYNNPELHFGGKGRWGHHVHEAVMQAYREGKIIQSAVTMHFVDDQYDHGPIFFRLPVLIRPDDTAETLAARVNEKERAWQSKALNWVVNKNIFLYDGRVFYHDHPLKKVCGIT